MEKFISLPIEKQNMIIDAALTSFSTNGYKKTSVSDIATAAGISKAMVFHYFGTKKKLYLYLIDLCGNIVENEVVAEFDNTITDFFDRIKLSSKIKISVMRKHPAILTFLGSIYVETDDEVKDDIKALLAKGENVRSKIVSDNIDFSKFKEGIDLKLFMKMFNCFAEGYISLLPNYAEIDLEFICKEFEECINLLKSNFYKEEYL